MTIPCLSFVVVHAVVVLFVALMSFVALMEGIDVCARMVALAFTVVFSKWLTIRLTRPSGTMSGLEELTSIKKYLASMKYLFVSEVQFSVEPYDRSVSTSHAVSFCRRHGGFLLALKMTNGTFSVAGDVENASVAVME